MMPKPKIDVFPIPLELRWKIYGYLLDGKHTRLTRRHRDDRAYKFHTNILAVNRTIHAEAEQRLYENNAFVLATHYLNEWDADGLNDELQQWVPLIRSSYHRTQIDPALESMREHSLQISLEHDSYPLEYAGLQNAAPGDCLVQSCVFLATDLESYCTVLAEYLQRQLGPTLRIGGGPGLMDETLSHQLVPLTPAHLKLSLRDSPYRPIDNSRQSVLLSPFRTVIGRSLRVSLSGDVNLLSREIDVRKYMSPSLTCTRAEQWAYFEICDRRKDLINATAYAGELDLAINMCVALRRDMSDLSNFPAFRQSTRLSKPWSDAMRLLGIDILLTMAVLLFKLRHDAGFISILRVIKAEIDRHTSQALEEPLLEAKSIFLHLNILALATGHEGATWFLPIDTVRYFIISLYLCSPDPYRAHDLELLRRCPKKDVVLSSDNLPLDRCSINVLPLRCVDLRRSSTLARKPSHMVGWNDARLLSQTSAAIRAKVSLKQAEHDMPITNFAEFDEMVGQERSS